MLSLFNVFQLEKCLKQDWFTNSQTTGGLYCSIIVL